MAPLISLPDPTGVVGRLLDAAELVQQVEPESALVGGVGVICRLGTAHRPTLDADMVVQERDPGLLEILRARPDTSEPAGSETHGVVIDGALIEIIEVGSVTASRVADIDDPRDRLFVAAHRWALDTAQTADVDTVPTSRVRRIAIATAAALAATKTHALVGRRGARVDKVGSDLLDVMMLFERHDGDGGLTAELYAAPFGLGQLVADQLAGLMGDAQRRTRALRLAREAAGVAVTLARLEDSLHAILE